jgi:5-methylcytosine-specific restriction endonuclease McrA
MKFCTKCNIEFPNTSEHFALDNRSKTGLASWCRTCFNKKTRDWQKRNDKRHKNNVSEWRKANPYSVRKSSLKRVNFTPELYDEMLEAQGNVCALCGTDKAGGSGTFHADHDHNTGNPRGLLCMSCNHTIGNIENKPADWMDKARKYINNGGFHTANSQEIVTQS